MELLHKKANLFFKNFLIRFIYEEKSIIFSETRNR
jgi:hypothetical protein